MSLSLLGVLEQANAPEYIDFRNISFNDGADKFFDIASENSDENNKNIINKSKEIYNEKDVSEEGYLQAKDKEEPKENIDQQLSNAVKSLTIEIQTATEKLKKRKALPKSNKMHVSKYVPMAEQVLRYQKSTPKRFRVPPQRGVITSKCSEIQIKSCGQVPTTPQNQTKIEGVDQSCKSSRVKHTVKTLQIKDGKIALTDYDVANYGVTRSKKQNQTTFANVPTGLFERYEQAKMKKEEMMKRLQAEQPIKIFKAKPAPKFAPPPVRINAATKLASAVKRDGISETTQPKPTKTVISKGKNLLPRMSKITSHPTIKRTTSADNVSKISSNLPRYKGAPILSTAERQRVHSANEQARLERARKIQEKEQLLRIQREKEEIEKARREASSFKAKPAPKFKKPFTIKPADRALTEAKGPSFSSNK